MKLYCPSCQQLVQAADIDLPSGWAKCAACQEVFELSAVLPGFHVNGPVDQSIVERPFNARAIVVEQSRGHLEIFIPRQGFRASTIGLLGFNIFWLGFIAFWTAGALGLWGGGGPPQPMQIGFAAFSTPFWIAGFAMSGAVAWCAFGTKRLQLDAIEMRLETRCLLYCKRRTIERELVQCARPHSPQVQGQTTPSYGAEVIFEKGSYVLPADNESEANWLISLINEFLKDVSHGRPKTHSF